MRTAALEDIWQSISSASSNVHHTSTIFALGCRAKTGLFQGVDRHVIRLLQEKKTRGASVIFHGCALKVTRPSVKRQNKRKKIWPTLNESRVSIKLSAFLGGSKKIRANLLSIARFNANFWSATTQRIRFLISPTLKHRKEVIWFLFQTRFCVEKTVLFLDCREDMMSPLFIS